MNLDEAWEYTADLFDALVQDSSHFLPHRGVAVMRTLWGRNKAWMLPYFDESGRLSVTLEPDQIDLPTTGDYTQAVNVMYNVITRLCSTKYSDLTAHRRFSPGDWVQAVTDFFLALPDHFSVETLVSGHADRSYPVLGDSAGRSFNPGTRTSRLIANLVDTMVPGYDRQSYPFCLCSSMYRLSYLIGNDSERLTLLKDLINTVYSQLVSRLRPTSATVVLSVNPLDILFASTHTDGDWGSCHNLLGGAYRTGPLSYLLDPVSAIAYAYIKTAPFNFEEEDLPLPRSGHRETSAVPLKLWRQMVYMYPDQGVAIHSREYPATMTQYAKQARRLSAQVLSKHLGLPYNWKKNTGSNFRVRSASDYAYADPPAAAIYFPQLVDRRDWEVEVGNSFVICPACGAERYPDYDVCYTDQWLCSNCANLCDCERCGQAYPWDRDRCESAIYDEDRRYCPDCFLQTQQGVA